MSDRYFMPAAIPRSMPTSWITVNCPSLSWQRKRENDKDILDCRSELHVQRNILYVCLFFNFVCPACFSFSMSFTVVYLQMSSYLHLSSPITLHCNVFLFSTYPSSLLYFSLYHSPFSDRQYMMWLWGCDSLETKLFVNVTNCLNATFVRYPLWAMQQSLRRPFMAPKKVR